MSSMKFWSQTPEHFADYSDSDFDSDFELDSFDFVAEVAYTGCFVVVDFAEVADMSAVEPYWGRIVFLLF